MRILCCGAGPIGSLCAARLQEAGFDLSIPARGKRITPPNHLAFNWIPAPFPRRIIGRQLHRRPTELKIGHARSAAVDMKHPADTPRRQTEGTGSAPAMDALCEYIVEAVHSSLAAAPHQAQH